MFYDQNGDNISVGSTVEFHGEVYTVEVLNGDAFGQDGTSTLTFDRDPHVDVVPDESNVLLIEY